MPGITTLNMVGHQVRPSTSEYRHSYKESKFRCFSRTYEDNLDYRQCRRRAEHDHNTDVFTWDEANWDSESNSSCDNQRPASVPIHKFKHHKLNETYSGRLNQTQEIKVKGPHLQTTVVVNGRSQVIPSLKSREVKASVAGKEETEAKERKEQRNRELVRHQEQQTSGRPI